MALRDQPYLPLYVNDFLSDEKLGECSAASTGVYIRLLCIMHKMEEYGAIKLKVKDKIKSKSIANFSIKLSKLMPYDVDTVESALEELVSENVIKIDGDRLWQPRMVKDGAISEVRSKAGSTGGKAVRNNAKKKLYNEPGFLYIAEDCNDELCHKIGISKDPKTRIQQLSSKSKREMKIVKLYEVDDMGITEDNALCQLQEVRDGEWVYNLPLSNIINSIQKIISTSKSQANTENETENEYEDENGKNSGIEEENDLGRVMSFYMDKINPTPSRICIDSLKQFTEALGADVVIHAFGVALDERKTSWSYIQAILARYERDGLKTLDAVVRAEQEHRERGKDRGNERRSGVSEGGAKTEYVIHYDNDD